MVGVHVGFLCRHVGVESASFDIFIFKLCLCLLNFLSFCIFSNFASFSNFLFFVIWRYKFLVLFEHLRFENQVWFVFLIPFLFKFIFFLLQFLLVFFSFVEEIFKNIWFSVLRAMHAFGEVFLGCEILIPFGDLPWVAIYFRHKAQILIKLSMFPWTNSLLWLGL